MKYKIIKLDNKNIEELAIGECSNSSYCQNYMSCDRCEFNLYVINGTTVSEDDYVIMFDNNINIAIDKYDFNYIRQVDFKTYNEN